MILHLQIRTAGRGQCHFIHLRNAFLHSLSFTLKYSSITNCLRKMQFSIQNGKEDAQKMELNSLFFRKRKKRENLKSERRAGEDVRFIICLLSLFLSPFSCFQIELSRASSSFLVTHFLLVSSLSLR